MTGQNVLTATWPQKRWNRENEVADAALRSPGGGERMACQKKKDFWRQNDFAY
jgi:hypothetical protein